MTAIDFLFIIVVLVMMAVGARLGSVWMGACLIGGFLGAFTADYYSLPFSELIGGFPGSGYFAYIVLYGLGLAAALIPGWIISRVGSALFLGIIDSAVGLLAGGLVGLLIISLALVLIVPAYPKFEKKRTWKESAIVKPLHGQLEHLFHKRSFRKPRFNEAARKSAVRKFKNMSGKIIEKIPE